MRQSRVDRPKVRLRKARLRSHSLWLPQIWWKQMPGTVKSGIVNTFYAVNVQ
ncbi:hypothetical protein [Fortiea sp. LEGE XX443]|uniref:hypothetical protein n=1 Tax=Fortiea sp. LEGE XX443 TaxID=1828611 RepID=UPI001D13A15F|nr:hypothetical protein [Fortiea sp. LEGE XX443]